MKKITAVMMLGIWASVTAFAQKSVKISGTITNAADPNFILANATSLNILPEPRQESITLSPEGKFTIEVPVTQKYSWIILAQPKTNQRIDFFVTEGSELTLTAEGRKMDSTVVFDGKGKEVPQYFAELSKKRGGIMGYFHKTQEVAINEPSTYQHALDSIRNDEEAYMKTSVPGKTLPKDFQAQWSAFLKYSTYDAMLHYPFVHEVMRLKSNDIKSIPPELYAVTKKTPVAFDDNNLNVAFYQTYVQSYYFTMLAAAGYNNVVQNDIKPEAQDRAKASQQTDSALHLTYKLMPKKTAEFAAGRIIVTENRIWTLDELEARNKEYKQHFPKSSNNAILDKIVYDIKKFNPGQPAIDFSFKTLEGKDVKLSDYKGKVVYLDFWASWCGPCKGEMPHAKKVKEYYKDRNDVVFLYVSIDDKEDAWKRGIDAMSISGIHTRTPGWKGKIAELYQIGTIPAYFLIDKKGNFVTKNTPRPSQTEELKKLIDGLL